MHQRRRVSSLFNTLNISTFIVILSQFALRPSLVPPLGSCFKVLLVLFIYYIIVFIHVLNKLFYVLIGQQHICQKDDWMTVKLDYSRHIERCDPSSSCVVFCH